MTGRDTAEPEVAAVIIAVSDATGIDRRELILKGASGGTK